MDSKFNCNIQKIRNNTKVEVKKKKKCKRQSYCLNEDDEKRCIVLNSHCHSHKLNHHVSHKNVFNEKDFSEPVWSYFFKDDSILLSNDRLTAVGNKGWCSVLLTHGCNSGCWYFEISYLSTPTQPVTSINKKHRNNSIMSKNDMEHNISRFDYGSEFVFREPHIRVGWSCRYSRFDMPIGCDQFGVCIRDVDGSLVTEGRKKKYSDESFKHGDIIGCGIILSNESFEIEDTRNKPELHPYLESGLLCDPQNPPKSFNYSSAYVEYTRNGKSLGCRNIDIKFGMYHPAVSLYMGAQCHINTGPEFHFPIPLLCSEFKNKFGYETYEPACNLSLPLY